MWHLFKERDGDLHKWTKELLEKFAAPFAIA
jgi:hypothetical protein